MGIINYTICSTVDVIVHKVAVRDSYLLKSKHMMVFLVYYKFYSEYLLWSFNDLTLFHPTCGYR